MFSFQSRGQGRGYETDRPGYGCPVAGGACSVDRADARRVDRQERERRDPAGSGFSPSMYQVKNGVLYVK
jgi:hypothetical protein